MYFQIQHLFEQNKLKAVTKEKTQCSNKKNKPLQTKEKQILQQQKFKCSKTKTK